ncbi:MAG: CBS domain-containing protein [Syntrophales bacterium]|nr:CBS domain-containing protein [Syntrophales bacterium]
MMPSKPVRCRASPGKSEPFHDNNAINRMASHLTIGPDEDIKKAALLLDERRIKRLPVVDGEEKLVA